MLATDTELTVAIRRMSGLLQDVTVQFQKRTMPWKSAISSECESRTAKKCSEITLTIDEIAKGTGADMTREDLCRRSFWSA